MTEEEQAGGMVTEAIRRLGPVIQTVNPQWAQLIMTILAFTMHVRPASEYPRILEIMERENPTRVEEVRAMEKAIVQVIEERAEAQGELRAVRRALASLVRSRLGECPEGLAQQIAATTDAEELHTAFERALALDDLAGFRLRA